MTRSGKDGGAAQPYSIRRSEAPDRSVLYEVETGESRGSMHLFNPFPGVIFSVNEFEGLRVPYDAQASREGLIVNLCIEGRCNVGRGGEEPVYLKPGGVVVSNRHAGEWFELPTGRYYGVEVFIDFDVMSGGVPSFLSDVGINPFSLCGRFCMRGCDHVDRLARPVVEHVALTVREEWFDVAHCRLLVGYLLKHIERLGKYGSGARAVFLTPVQASIARRAEAEMTRDLSTRVTLGDVARRYDVSESSLRLYFESMFGKSVSSYMRDLRMDRAAELLEGTDETVGAIALATGYASQSKFASAFRECKGLTPFEYRRAHRLAGPMGCAVAG